MNEKDCLMLQYISEEQSLTKAAERLFITQPALTYRLQQMERELGVPIIIKHAKGTKFTPEGEYLVAYAKKTLDELYKMKEYVANMRNEVKGNLRLGVSSYFGLYKLPPLLKTFISLYPEVQPIVTCALSSEIVELLMQEEIHLGVIRGEYPWLYAKYLLHDEHICIISREPIDLDKLPELQRIDYKQPISHSPGAVTVPFSDAINAWWRERYQIPPKITMQVDSYETCREMVKHGLGYSIIPGIFVTPSDGLYKLDLVRANGEPMKRNTWMLYKESMLQLAVVDRFVGFMKEQHKDDK